MKLFDINCVVCGQKDQISLKPHVIPETLPQSVLNDYRCGFCNLRFHFGIEAPNATPLQKLAWSEHPANK